jgi:hypothetical protein
MGKSGRMLHIMGLDLWTKSTERTEVVDPCYVYMGEEFIDRADGTYYNVYQKSGSWPNEEDNVETCEPIIDHLSAMMGDNLDMFRSYLKFLKYTSIKPTSFPVLHSTIRGVGKGWTLTLAANMIGRSNALPSGNTKTFVSDFNKELEGKRLININELKCKGDAKDRAMNNIRNYIADPTMRVEGKGTNSYTSDAVAGMLVTANRLEDVPNDGLGDRRIWYINCKFVQGSDKIGYWNPLFRMIEETRYLRSFAKWVEQGEDVDFSSWRPPLTEEREEAILESMDSSEQSIYETVKQLREEGFICMHLNVFKLALRRYGGWNVPDFMKDQTLAALMKRVETGLRRTDDKYGSPVQYRPWVIVETEFHEIEFDKKSVVAECDRAAKVFGIDPKY